MPITKSLSITESISVTESISIRLRTCYSIQHIQSAALFARLSAKIEKAYDGEFSDELFAEHRAYVTGCIFAAVSFLEATINELFADAVDNPNGHIKQLNPNLIALMANMWRLGVPRTASFPIPNKFQIALTLAQKQPLDTGVCPYQDVDLLCKLRNALIHYEPEWVTTVSTDQGAVTGHKFEKMLRGKFPLNPLAGQGNPFFPDKCLGHGCAEWAVISSVEFVDEFFSRMSLTPTFDHVRSRLKTE